MTTLDISGKAIEIDNEGYLNNLDDWSNEVAEQLAIHEGITLTPAHWEIIDLLRKFYAEFNISPSMRILVKVVKQRYGSKKGQSIYLMGLFPDSPVKRACKIAGLPKPTNCL